MFISSTIASLHNALQVACDLQYLSQLDNNNINNLLQEDHNFIVVSVALQFRDKGLKDARVSHSSNIINIPHIMVHIILSDECAEELSKNFINYKLNKIVTVVIAAPIAKYS